MDQTTIGMTGATSQDLQVLSALQNQFGSIDYNAWQINRWSFYCYVQYPSAGLAQIPFFGFTAGQGGATLADTNLPKAGSVGQQHFLLKSIHTSIRIPTNAYAQFQNANADTHTLASDFLAGFVQAGVLTLTIGAKPFIQVFKPFQYLPPEGGIERVVDGGITQFTDNAGAVLTWTSDVPYVTQNDGPDNAYILDPQVLIAAEEQFSCSIDYPSGVIPIIASNVVNDSTDPLKVGVILSGVLARPLQ